MFEGKVKKFIEQSFHMFSSFFNCFFIGLCNIDWSCPTYLIRRCFITILNLRYLSVLIKKFAYIVKRTVVLSIDVFSIWMCSPFNCFRRPKRGAPDWGVRLLVGPWPDIHIFEMIVLAFECKRTFFCPGPDN